MSKTCKACRKNLSKGSLKLQCGRCCAYFHLDCGGVTEVDARLMQVQKTPWNCRECEDNSARRISLQLSSARSPGGDLQELKFMIREMQSELREVRQSMDFINQKFEEERERNKIMTEMFSEMSKENKTLRLRVEQLERAVNIENTKKIQQNICLSGFPLNKDNGTKVAANDLVNLFSSLGVSVSQDEFVKVTQFTTKAGAKISVTLRDIELKNRILAARSKKGKITPRICGLGLSDVPIFVDEELTKEAYTLFKKAKGLKNSGFKYVWHRNGKILARKNDGDNVLVIKSEDVLNELIS